MKKRKVFFASVLLILLAVTTCYTVFGTYAKYATKLTGNDTARVAKWAWEINNENITSTTKTIKDFDLFSNSVLLDSSCTTAETDVTSSNSDKVIAPGTCGKFTINVKNNSEVTAKYGYTLSLTNAGNVPLLFRKGTDGQWTKDLSTLSVADSAEGSTLAVGAAKKEATIYWKWDFPTTDNEETDATDTALGFAGTAKVTVDATLNLTQVD